MIAVYIVVGLVALLWAFLLAFFICEINKAPLGWEDKDGFHYGKEPNNLTE